MKYMILIIITIICAFGWLVQRISNMILLRYLQEKNYPLPSNEDMERGQKWVVKHMLNDLLKIE